MYYLPEPTFTGKAAAGAAARAAGVQRRARAAVPALIEDKEQLRADRMDAANDGWNTASDKSNGRRDEGIERARAQSANRDRALKNAPDGNELNRYRGISKKLGTTPEALRARYVAAATANPDLKFGQFVSANVVADNLRGRYPGVTTSAILTGLQNGDSLGQTLKTLRVPSETAKRAEKEAKQRIKDSMPR